MHTFFLAPTCFGVGLPSVTLGLIRALERSGLRVLLLKPIAQPHPGDSGLERSTALINRTAGLQPPAPMDLHGDERRMDSDVLDQGREAVVSRNREAAKSWE